MIPYEISIKYMLAGYSVILIILAIYLASLVTRWKNLKSEYRILKELEKK
jgi:hypothetical protein